MFKETIWKWIDEGMMKMNRAAYPRLFEPLDLNGLRFRNRMTMAPLYLGYAALSGKVSPLLLNHYRVMAQSGAALIVGENSSVSPKGSASPRTLRCDHDRYIKGLESLAGVIKRENTGSPSDQSRWPFCLCS